MDIQQNLWDDVCLETLPSTWFHKLYHNYSSSQSSIHKTQVHSKHQWRHQRDIASSSMCSSLASNQHSWKEIVDELLNPFEVVAPANKPENMKGELITDIPNLWYHVKILNSWSQHEFHKEIKNLSTELTSLGIAEN